VIQEAKERSNNGEECFSAEQNFQFAVVPITKELVTNHVPGTYYSLVSNKHWDSPE
jgi:hypothetical protein